VKIWLLLLPITANMQIEPLNYDFNLNLFQADQITNYGTCTMCTFSLPFQIFVLHISICLHKNGQVNDF